MEIIKATKNQIEDIATLCLELWPHHTILEMREEVTNLLKSNNVFFLASVEVGYIGFTHLSVRHEYVESAKSPVAYLEGIFVKEKYRKQGVASKLVEQCEVWARKNGYTQIASDCELSNNQSEKFHKAIGFKEVSRNIHFVKTLK